MSAPVFRCSSPRPERLARIAAPYWQGRTGNMASTRMGSRWRSLPVEGSKAWQQSRPGFIARLIGGRS